MHVLLQDRLHEQRLGLNDDQRLSCFFLCVCAACVVLFCSFAALSAKAEWTAHAWCDANGKSTQEAGLLLIVDERLLLDSIAHNLFI